jgi:hypothetical protein
VGRSVKPRRGVNQGRQAGWLLGADQQKQVCVLWITCSSCWWAAAGRLLPGNMVTHVCMGVVAHAGRCPML